MASFPTYNLGLPYIGIVDGGFHPGKLVRIQGTVLPSANRFSINLQCGPNVSPRDDIAIHVSPRFNENYIARNSLQNVAWGIEENHGPMPLARGQGFEIIILCEPTHYKIAVNGQHYAEYGHRIPYQRVTYLAIDGDVTISLINYEGGSRVPGGGVGFVPPLMTPVPPPPMPGSVPYPTNPTAYPTVPGAVPYGAPPPVPGGYAYQPGYAHGYPKSHHGHGGIGTALGAGVAGAALTGHLSPKKAYKAQKKSHKKALKYGLPVAGLGLGAYALHKGFHHGSSSSSSSSSSSEEE
ncbi:galectin-4-like isoform X2 [Zootermopsis nevadensis]|uniref:galectin-4-like isoform X2 n=1 Tax=Zootermopsis nevadensis TaxID=136037 RepID=UPI000B8E8D21|nr:galectin-4-like isoform X2 [Zootermopsis nevadensis]